MKQEIIKILEFATNSYKLALESGEITQEHLKEEVAAWKNVHRHFTKSIEEIESLVLPDADTWVSDFIEHMSTNFGKK